MMSFPVTSFHGNINEAQAAKDVPLAQVQQRTPKRNYFCVSYTTFSHHKLIRDVHPQQLFQFFLTTH